MFENLQSSYKKFLTRSLAVFVAMFLLRLAYGFFYPGASAGTFFSEAISVGNSSRKNYASEKMKPQTAGQAAPGNAYSQKYEKIATVKSKSANFPEDEARAKKTIQDFKAIIQYEQNTGNAGSRQMNLAVGVRPEKFDSFYIEIQKVGRVLSRDVSKTDKTNEYRELNAKKASLEKTRNSLLELKSRSGNIDEFIGLENRILEIEKELQGLGVSLGDFDEENELCTVRFALIEGAEAKISLAQRLKAAFEWTVKYYFLFGFGLFLFLLVMSLAQSIFEKSTITKNKQK